METYNFGGVHSLIKGDCFDFIKSIESSSFDHILTDPPFGNGDIKYGRSELGHRAIANDENLDWLPEFAKEAFRVLVDDAHCVLYWQWRTFTVLKKVMESAGFELKTVGIWDKKNSGLGSGLAEGYEQICFFRKGNAKEEKFRSNVFRYARVAGRTKHPHQKPVKLHRDILQTISPPAKKILDPFGGVFTVGEACLEEDFFYTGVEIDKNHFSDGLSVFKECYDFNSRQTNIRREALKLEQLKLL